MHPAARRCVIWAIVLLVIGAASYLVAPWFFVNVESTGFDGVVSARASEFILFLGQWCATAIGASLIGAAVVIQTLAGKEAPHAGDQAS